MSCKLHVFIARHQRWSTTDFDRPPFIEKRPQVHNRALRPSLPGLQSRGLHPVSISVRPAGVAEPASPLAYGIAAAVASSGSGSSLRSSARSSTRSIHFTGRISIAFDAVGDLGEVLDAFRDRLVTPRWRFPEGVDRYTFVGGFCWLLHCRKVMGMVIMDTSVVEIAMLPTDRPGNRTRAGEWMSPSWKFGRCLFVYARTTDSAPGSTPHDR